MLWEYFPSRGFQVACSQVSSQIAEVVLSRPCMCILCFPNFPKTACITLWYVLPNSQTRILLCQPYPSIDHHTLRSGISSWFCVWGLMVQICPRISERWWHASAVVFTATHASAVQALGKAGERLLFRQNQELRLPDTFIAFWSDSCSNA